MINFSSPTAAAFAATFLLAVAPLGAQELLSHNGDADPESEGWTYTAETNQYVGPVVENGEAAWEINDFEGTVGSFPAYRFSIEQADDQKIGENGLVASFDIKLGGGGDVTPTLGASIDITLHSLGSRWLYYIGSFGDKIVLRHHYDQTEYSTPADAEEFNTFEFRNSPGSMSLDLYVNGELVQENIVGVPHSLTRTITLGSQGSAEIGRLFWRSASIAIPE